ncbi:hypothetical protein EON67_01065 [archaeon]|nr:MAG: hypothetical protein EON67_01065 [archaeon]
MTVCAPLIARVRMCRKWMAPSAGGPAAGAVGEAIDATFGSFDKMKEEFSAAATVRAFVRRVHSARVRARPTRARARTRMWQHAHVHAHPCRRCLAAAGRGWCWTPPAASPC